MKIRYPAIMAVVLAVSVALAGCGGQQKQAQGGAVPVNTYKITAADAQVETSFNGTIIAQNKVAVHARVSGHVIEKYVKGGQQVTQGQPLFRLDSRSYQAALASAQAGAAQANAAYQNAAKDLERYQILAAQDAIAQRTLDTQSSTAQQSLAAYEATNAQVQIAQDNLNDTVVYAPFSGTLEMDDVDLGTYVAAGQTTLVTIDSVDPIFVEFSMSENEYLNFMKQNKGPAVGGIKDLQLKLADGSTYAHLGTLVQAGKDFSSNSGKLILKASFDNPEHLLLPGMYATVVSPGEPIKDAIMIPTKAIVQVLDKNFVMVVQEDNTIKQVPVTLGGSQGIYTIVTGGIKPGEEIVVDGLTKIRNGSAVKVTELTKEQIQQGK